MTDTASPSRIVASLADLAYVRAQYRAIDVLKVGLPAPSYYDAQGRAYVPHDYEAQETDRRRFSLRASAEVDRLGATYDDAWIADAWDAYWDGIYGMCLRNATPENIIRKNWLIDRITTLIEAPHADESWLAKLRDAVDALDTLERPFCAFDRAYFGGPVSRDIYIDAVRERFPPVRRANSSRANSNGT